MCAHVKLGKWLETCALRYADEETEGLIHHTRELQAVGPQIYIASQMNAQLFAICLEARVMQAVQQINFHIIFFIVHFIFSKTLQV